LSAARLLLAAEPESDTLVLTDVTGATPANVARRLVNRPNTRLVAGVNLPMLLRTVCYRHESLDQLTERAMDGGTQGVCRLEGNPVNT
jgi:PTS system ascorbate-specific IIA component